MTEFHLTEPGRLALELSGSSGYALYLLDIAWDVLEKILVELFCSGKERH